MGLIDWLFPQQCLACGKLGSYLCPDCFLKIKSVETQICPVCTHPVFHGLTHPGCQRQLRLDGLVSLFAHQGPIKKALKKIRFSSLFDLLPLLGSWALEELEENETLYRFFVHERPLVVPIPRHWFYQRKQGFNQAAFLGEYFAPRWNLPFCGDLLVCEKYFPTQVGLTKKQKEERVRGLFRVNKGVFSLLKCHAPSVFLVDDLWITGATMKEAGRVLKRAGIKKIWGLTLARQD